MLSHPWLEHSVTRALIIPAIAGLLLASSAWQVTAAQASDDAAIRDVIGVYFRGHATGDSAVMRSAFLSTAHIEGIRGGAFNSWTVDEYVSGFRGRPAPDEATRTRTVDLVDVSGTAAMARATLTHGATTFTDYFVLLKVDGAWKIANKVYHAQR